MRKTLLIFFLLLAMGGCACAEALPMAAGLDAHARFERYQSFQLDESTGEWSARTLAADQLLSAIQQGTAGGSMGGGVCILYPGVRGNRDLSLLEPVLYVYLFRNRPIQADAISIAAGGVRYDFALAAEETAVDSRKCERFALPLDEEMFPLLESFAAEGGEIRIYGESNVFRTSVAEADEYRNGKQRVEAMSIAAARDFLALWPEDYGLWDLNAAHWPDGRPEAAAVALDAGVWADALPALEPATQCLDTENRDAVRAYQQLLKERAFFTGKVDAAFGKITREATRQVQALYGLVPTGMPDRALIGCLLGGAQEREETHTDIDCTPLAEGVAQALPGETYVVAGRLSLRLDRAWTAYSFSPSRAAEGMNRLWPANRSSRLYLCDGEIANLSGASMSLPATLQGSLLVDGVAFPCAVQCERDRGEALGTTLLPMETARLVIACELPEGADAQAAELQIALQAGEGKSRCALTPERMGFFWTNTARKGRSPFALEPLSEAGELFAFSRENAVRSGEPCGRWAASRPSPAARRAGRARR